MSKTFADGIEFAIWVDTVKDGDLCPELVAQHFQIRLVDAYCRLRTYARKIGLPEHHFTGVVRKANYVSRDHEASILNSAGHAGKTCPEISHHLSIPLGTVRPAVSKLIRAGLLVPTGDRRLCGSSVPHSVYRRAA